MAFYFERRFLCLVLLVLLGILRGISFNPVYPTTYFDQKLPVCGTVGFPSEKKSFGIHLVLTDLTINQKSVWGRLQVTLHEKQPRSLQARQVGTRLCFSESITPIKNFGIPGEFDMERYFYLKKIWGRVTLKKETPLDISPRYAYYPVQRARERFSNFSDRFAQGAILKALVLGMQSDLPKRLKDDFVKSGLIHLLVISGQNIALLLMFFFSVFYGLSSRSATLLLYAPLQKILIIFSIPLVILFCLFSGAEIPIFRATLMALSLLSAIWYSRPQSGFYGLCVALALILNLMPASLKDPSFQLSFLALCGLMSLPAALGHRWKRVRRHPLKLLLATTLAALLMTTPVVLTHFHRFSVVALLSNLIAVPFVSFLLLPLAFAITALFFIWPWLAVLLMKPFALLAAFLVYLANFFASFPWSSVFWAPPTLLQLFVLYGCGAGVLVSLSKRRFKIAIGLIIGCLVFLGGHNGIHHIHRRLDKHLRVSFLSVGQGDATLLELPKGKTMLIDAGGLFGQFDVGERLLAPYLWQKGIRKLDVLVISHGDYDHVQGFEFILKYFKVGEIWLSQFKGKKYFFELIALAEQKAIPFYLMSKHSPSREIQHVHFHFLNPASPFNHDSDNNLSLVMRCVYKNFSILFTGDIEREVEESLPRELRSLILKVPHHGSKTSSSALFLEQVKPRLAVISAGRHNYFGHPHHSVLERYARHGIAVWRTDLKGTLHVKTDGLSSSLPLFIRLTGGENISY